MFPEAEVLNWLDVLDSRLNEMREAQTRTRQELFLNVFLPWTAESITLSTSMKKI